MVTVDQSPSLLEQRGTWVSSPAYSSACRVFTNQSAVGRHDH